MGKNLTDDGELNEDIEGREEKVTTPVSFTGDMWAYIQRVDDGAAYRLKNRVGKEGWELFVKPTLPHHHSKCNEDRARRDPQVVPQE
jgi:hypothetical protein